MILAARTTPLPATVDDLNGFHAAGFRFGVTTDHEPLLRHTTLPRGWHAIGTSAWPESVVDQLGRRRVTILYPVHPRTRQRGAVMRLVTLREYLARCVAEAELPAVDAEWATPAAIVAVAVVEIEHADYKLRYFQERQQNRSVADYLTARARWSRMAAHFDTAGVAA